MVGGDWVGGDRYRLRILVQRRGTWLVRMMRNDGEGGGEGEGEEGINGWVDRLEGFFGREF
jgi:hypothetical protein